MADQTELFTAASLRREESTERLPEGFEYRPEFISAAEESELVGLIRELPLQEAQYRQFTARRRIVSFGGSYDFLHHELLPAGPLPEFLLPIRARISAWTSIPAEAYTHALVAEYQIGTPLGWHRDVPDFEAIAGLSLAGSARMRLRPYPPAKGRRDLTIRLDLEPRSAYAIVGVARWRWQHAISPTKELRYSITFRTRRSGTAAASGADR
ncbi:MAG TPA: alpha-ketoglutarate-dependent dioxygenase AlkB [Candidatus Limnocylindrales bacterium]|nr:alpha-ketoglutarate-dependent dioxygenase AlkB [Candidatus Limnocylindrales bacterium]